MKALSEKTITAASQCDGAITPRRGRSGPLLVLAVALFALVPSCSWLPFRQVGFRSPITPREIGLIEVSLEGNTGIGRERWSVIVRPDQRGFVATGRRETLPRNPGRSKPVVTEAVALRLDADEVAEFVDGLRDLWPSDSLIMGEGVRGGLPRAEVRLLDPEKRLLAKALSTSPLSERMIPWNVYMNGRLFVQRSGELGDAHQRLLKRAFPEGVAVGTAWTRTPPDRDLLERFPHVSRKRNSLARLCSDRFFDAEGRLSPAGSDLLEWLGLDLLPDLVGLLDSLTPRTQESAFRTVATLDILDDRVQGSLRPNLYRVKTVRFTLFLSERAIRDPEPRVRRAAAWFLGEMQAELGLEALVEAIRDEDDRVRDLAADSVGRIKSETPIDSLITVALEDRRAATRASALMALSTIGGQWVVRPLVDGSLRDGNEENRQVALNSVRSLDEARALPLYVDAALRDSNRKVRDRALTAVQTIGTRLAVELLLAARRDPDDKVRRRLVSILDRLGAKLALPALAEMAKGDPKPKIRIRALRSLAKIHLPGSHDALVEIALRDEEPRVRQEAATHVERLRSEKMLDGLIGGLSDPSPTVQKRARAILLSIGYEI